ncbi:MAG: SRPBCC family protein [Nevskiales bacterium]|nr:SRPBCC family protein [Nevskiales bacterium]
MSVRIVNSVEMRCTPQALYDEVTRPWRWHHWHPNSLSARADRDTLAVGDSFDEVIAVQPLSPLPLTLRRQTRYRVLAAEPYRLWETEGRMSDGWLRIRYEFAPSTQGTRFTRTLTFSTRGLSRLLMPLLRGRMARMSRIALANLQRHMEG